MGRYDIHVGQVYSNGKSTQYRIEKKVLAIGKEYNYWKQDGKEYTLYEVVAGPEKGMRFICSLDSFVNWAKSGPSDRK